MDRTTPPRVTRLPLPPRSALLLVLGLVFVSTPESAGAQTRLSDGIGHPRRVRSFIGVYQEQEAPVSTQLVRMGLGDGLFLASGRAGGVRYHIELAAAVQAEFDLAVSSFDFLVADFIVGVPVRWSRGRLGGRVALYHQSSHLGDDILDREDVTPGVDGAVDFEALEAFVGYRMGLLRPYVGAEYRFRRTPDAQDPSVFHAGIDVQGPGKGTYGLFAGVHGWAADQGLDSYGGSARAGLEVRRGRRGREGRPVRLLLEAMVGSPDAGRFYSVRRAMFGFAVEVGR